MRIRRYSGCALLCLMLVVIACERGTATNNPSVEDLALRPRMTIGVVEVPASGQPLADTVNPDQAGGGYLITIEAVTPERLVFAVRATLNPDALSRGATSASEAGGSSHASAGEPISLRRRVVVNGWQNSHRVFIPLYWPAWLIQPVEVQTDSSTMWLSQTAFNELKSTGQTLWTQEVLTAVTSLGVSLPDEVRRQLEGRQVYLRAVPEPGQFTLRVNGEQREVQALIAHDDFGNTYTILDSAANPLILKFAFNGQRAESTLPVDEPVWEAVKAIASGFQVLEINFP